MSIFNVVPVTRLVQFECPVGGEHHHVTAASSLPLFDLQALQWCGLVSVSVGQKKESGLSVGC